MGVTDIEAVVRDWVTEQLSMVSGRQGRITPPAMEIDWSRVHFSTARTDFGRSPSNQTQSGGSHVVFKSNYENKTDQVQDHTFSMDRTTEAIVRTKVVKGFSRNGTVGININVPSQVSNHTGSFGSDIVVRSEDENIVKHEVSWGLNTTVKAPPKLRTVAELKITESEYKCTFSSEVHMRGRVVVRLADDQVMENDLAAIMQEMESSDLYADGLQGFQGRKVSWMVTGELKFKFGVSQDVRVWSERL